MPIYSSLYNNLARQGVTKTFTHGYAQSVVAATHPQTYVSNNRPGFSLQRRPSKVTPFAGYHFQNAFHTSASASNLTVESRLNQNDGGLAAYYEAWKKSHVAGEPEQEWEQFQFAKRIEWKPELEQVEDVEGGETVRESATATETPKLLERAYSTSAVDDIKKIELGAEEQAALAKVDAAIEKEIQLRAEQANFETELSVVAARVPSPVVDTQSPVLTESVEKSPTSVATTVSAPVDTQSQSYAEHLTKLSKTGRYAEIPAVFEAMLVANIQPSAVGYNALLDAAIHLPAERIQVVPKALDVYSDMLHRKVLPDTATYDKLINLLASRSLEIASQKKALETKRAQFGGVNEAGKFMFASDEVEYHILAEDDRLDLAVRMFDASISYRKDRSYPAETYHQLISACSEAGPVPDMVRLYEHMETKKVTPLAVTFHSMINGFTNARDLNSAVECYNEYKRLAIDSNNGKNTLKDRNDSPIYGAVIRAYIMSDKVEGAMRFDGKLREQFGHDGQAWREMDTLGGFIRAFREKKMFPEALFWASKQPESERAEWLRLIAAEAAEVNDGVTATMAFNAVGYRLDEERATIPIMCLCAMHLRMGNIAAAQPYWQLMTQFETPFNSAHVIITMMYAESLLLSGRVAEGLNEAERMYAHLGSLPDTINGHAQDYIEEGLADLQILMERNNIVDPRVATSETIEQTYMPAPYPEVSPVPTVPTHDDTFDPYAASTDFRGSTLIADELERGNNNRKGSRLNEALNRFRNMRRAGRHPRYITYAKLIAAAAREERGNLVHDILGMARTDVPMLPQYSIVRYGWASILDAMVGACLNLGNRQLAAQYHQELLDMGAAPTANTFGLYITTMKESAKTFDEASEAVKIFHQAQSQGVEPSSFLYNALIGKLGKARRIDDCLFYFNEMRRLNIRPTSVTYGTIVNALCRVSDEKFAEQLFEEMESMPNYKPRPAPYNSLMQFFLTTKRDQSKVLAYYERMKSKRIEPTSHTYKLLIDTHATLEPINMAAAEAVLDVIRSTGQHPEAVHYASLIHAKGCVLHDMEGARAVFDSVIADRSIRPQACLYQALFESMVANHHVAETESILRDMANRHVDMTPYIANTLIHGWTNEHNIHKCELIFNSVPREKREPSTYEAMTRAYLSVEHHLGARTVVDEMLSRGYPAAVSNKVYDLLGGGHVEHST